MNPDRSRPLDRDKLSMFPRNEAIRLAHEALRPVSNLQPEEMVAAVAVLFGSVCNRVGLDPEDMHRFGLRLVKHQAMHDKENKLLQSLRDFAGLRIAGQDVGIS